MDDKEKEMLVEIWKRTIETQMHFNEMSVKSRQLGLTFATAALGLATILLSREEEFAIDLGWGAWTVSIHLAAVITLGAAVALSAVRNLDLYVYHKMLRGAVAFGEDLENRYLKTIFPMSKGLTQAVSHFSRTEDAGVSTCDDGSTVYTGTKKVTAFDKLNNFYRIAIWALVAITGLLIFLTSDISLQLDV